MEQNTRVSFESVAMNDVRHNIVFKCHGEGGRIVAIKFSPREIDDFLGAIFSPPKMSHEWNPRPQIIRVGTTEREIVGSVAASQDSHSVTPVKRAVVFPDPRTLGAAFAGIYRGLEEYSHTYPTRECLGRRAAVLDTPVLRPQRQLAHYADNWRRVDVWRDPENNPLHFLCLAAMYCQDQPTFAQMLTILRSQVALSPGPILDLFTYRVNQRRILA